MQSYKPEDCVIEVDGVRVDPSTFVNLETFTVQAPPLDIAVYEKIVLGWARYPNRGRNIFYPALGLCGEAGEVAEHAKKMHRDDGNRMTPERLEKVKKELGDVLWYAAAVASEVGTSLAEVTGRATFAELRQARENLTLDTSFMRESLTLCKYTGQIAAAVSTYVENGDLRMHYVIGMRVRSNLIDAVDTLCTICTVVGTDLETIALANVDKLAGRAQRGTIQGSGDDR